MVNEIIRVIKKINGEGKTILLVEQNVRHALANSDRAYVLENGTIKMEGTGEELMKNKDIKTAYLGL
jgi:branched-chain amino acid transport system ATP-binding protein